jgi:hypothetical protein
MVLRWSWLYIYIYIYVCLNSFPHGAKLRVEAYAIGFKVVEGGAYVF